MSREIGFQNRIKINDLYLMKSKGNSPYCSLHRSQKTIGYCT